MPVTARRVSSALRNQRGTPKPNAGKRASVKQLSLRTTTATTKGGGALEAKGPRTRGGNGNGRGGIVGTRASVAGTAVCHHHARVSGGGGGSSSSSSSTALLDEAEPNNSPKALHLPAIVSPVNSPLQLAKARALLLSARQRQTSRSVGTPSGSLVLSRNSTVSTSSRSHHHYHMTSRAGKGLPLGGAQRGGGAPPQKKSGTKAKQRLRPLKGPSTAEAPPPATRAGPASFSTSSLLTAPSLLSDEGRPPQQTTLLSPLSPSQAVAAAGRTPPSPLATPLSMQRPPPHAEAMPTAKVSTPPPPPSPPPQQQQQQRQAEATASAAERTESPPPPCCAGSAEAEDTEKASLKREVGNASPRLAEEGEEEEVEEVRVPPTSSSSSPPPPPRLADSADSADADTPELQEVFALMLREMEAAQPPVEEVQAWMLRWFESYHRAQLQQEGGSGESTPHCTEDSFTSPLTFSDSTIALTATRFQQQQQQQQHHQQQQQQQQQPSPGRPPIHPFVVAAHSPHNGRGNSGVGSVSLASSTSSSLRGMRPTSTMGLLTVPSPAQVSRISTPVQPFSANMVMSVSSFSTTSETTAEVACGISTLFNPTGPSNPYNLGKDLQAQQRDYEVIASELFHRMDVFLNRLGDAASASSPSSSSLSSTLTGASRRTSGARRDSAMDPLAPVHSRASPHNRKRSAVAAAPLSDSVRGQGDDTSGFAAAADCSAARTICAVSISSKGAEAYSAFAAASADDTTPTSITEGLAQEEERTSPTTTTTAAVSSPSGQRRAHLKVMGGPLVVLPSATGLGGGASGPGPHGCPAHAEP